jgi:hypothetical protein
MDDIFVATSNNIKNNREIFRCNFLVKDKAVINPIAT